MSSLISIIVPIYNTEQYLAKCIESILEQTYHRLELILINDGSTDHSLDICKHYQSMDERIVLIDKRNEGVSAARNLGISLAKGDYIGFVDSDDYIEKNMYETLIRQMEEDNTALCVMSYHTIRSYGLKQEKRIISQKEAINELLLLRFPTSLWACLYSKDIIKGISLNAQIHFFEDFEFNYRILLDADRISLCNQELYHYRTNVNGANNQSINDKRLSCLKVGDIVLESLKNKHPDLMKSSIYFRTHFLISVILSIAKSHNVDIKYYEKASQYTRKIRKEALLSKLIPLKYKLVLFLYLLSPSLSTRSIYYIRRFMR
jgi:glycosyltransferase involved in cell wall biosynthesis